MSYEKDSIFHVELDRRSCLSLKYADEEIISQQEDGHLFPKVDHSTIPMWVADMDFHCFPELQQALSKRLEHPTFGYTAKPIGYFDSIIQWHKRRFHTTLDRSYITTVQSVLNGISIVINEFSQEGDSILVHTPGYSQFFHLIEKNKRKLITSELKLINGHYEMDLKDMKRKIVEDKVKLMLLCSPHNPVGRVWTEVELVELVQLCKEHNVLLVSDEIWADIIFDSYTHRPMYKICPNDTITLTAPSKSFSVAGAGIGYAIIPNEDLRKRFHDFYYRMGFFPLNNLFSDIVLVTCYTKGEGWLKEMIEYVRANMEYVSEFCKNELGGKIKFASTVESTYLIWLDCTNLQLDTNQLGDLFKRANVFVSQSKDFYPKQKNQLPPFIRMNVACPLSVVKKAMNQIKQAIAQ